MTNQPDAATRTVTCRVAIKPTGAANYFDVGNTTDYVQNNEDQQVDVPSPQKGYNTVVDERITQRKRTFEVTVSTFSKKNIEIVNLATTATIITQTAASGLSSVLTGVSLADVYYLGARNVTAVVVQEGAIVRTQDVDYILDTGIGSIQILRGGSISEGVNLNVSYARPLEQRLQWIFDSKRTHTGRIRIHLFDQFAEDEISLIEFDGNYRATELAPASVGNLGSFKLRFLATGRITENGRII